MTNYTHTFPLKCYDALKEYTQWFMEPFNKDDIYVITLPIPKELVKAFDDEMAEYGLPASTNMLAFKRKNWITPTIHTVHVDFHEYRGQFTFGANNLKNALGKQTVLEANTSAPGDIEFIDTAIVLPVEGCKGTSMYWMDGSYEIKRTFLPDNSSLMSAVFEGEPKIVHQVEIVDEPTLCKVSLPHDALSNADGSYRTILSIRLQGNLSFEEIIKRRMA